jgi:hypothetical protein
MYRRFASADLVRLALRDHGIEMDRIHVVPDRASGIDDAADFGLYDAVIHDLDLPEADKRDYQDAVRRGDFIVSARVSSEEVPRVEEIMRHPEAFADRVDQAEFASEIEAEQTASAPGRAEPGPLTNTMPIGR